MTETDAVSPLSYDDLVWVCTNLCELIEVENEALRQHDPVIVRELAENKEALARFYERAVAPMADDPSLLDTFEPEQKEELKALGTRLAELMEANALMLRAEIEARDRVMNVVVDVVRKQNANTISYGRGGKFDPSQGTHAERNAIALNKTL
jgi:hypothetical protein